MTFAVYWLIGSCVALSAVDSAPNNDGAIDYLRTYGYLPKSITRFGDDKASDSLLHEDTVSDALKALQRLGKIEETGVLDDATKALLRKPRCGNPDFEIATNFVRRRRQKRYLLGPTKWDKTVLTWKYMNKNIPRHGRDVGQIRRLIHEAMEIWQHNSNLKLRESGEDTADILIDFAKGNHGDNFDFNGMGGSLAHAFYPGTGIGGDVHLDDDEIWDIETGETKEYDSVSFFYTLLHELGHSFGLGHSSTLDSIMYPYYSSSRTFDRTDKQLYEDDINAIEQLYGLKDGKRRYGPIGHKTTRHTTPTPTKSPRDRERERERATPPPPPTTTHAPMPDKCQTSYDAIGMIRGELMIFKDTWMWRLRDGKLMQPNPVEFKRMWPKLEVFDHIDAVFERTDGKFVFFSGQEVMVIDSRQHSATFNLNLFGFGGRVKKIDAIFRWGWNNKTYVFSGDDYWKVDEDLHVDRNERDYPRKVLGFWKGVRSIKLDTAFQTEGITYFFSGQMFYKFNDKKKLLELSKPQVSSQFWMGCQYSEEEITSIQKSARIQNETSSATSNTTSDAGVEPERKKVVSFVITFPDDDALHPDSVPIHPMLPTKKPTPVFEVEDAELISTTSSKPVTKSNDGLIYFPLD